MSVRVGFGGAGASGVGFSCFAALCGGALHGGAVGGSVLRCACGATGTHAGNLPSPGGMIDNFLTYM